MAIGTTVDIPEPLYEKLRMRAHQTGASMRALIVRAIEEKYIEAHQGTYVTSPPLTGKGKLGPAFPVDENPHDLVFS
jgi:CO dehydrogenase/acetyl-CoA synthase epsilon subunit